MTFPQEDGTVGGRVALQGAHGKELSQSLTLLSDSPHKVKNTSLDFVLLFQMAFPFVPLHLLFVYFACSVGPGW